MVAAVARRCIAALPVALVDRWSPPPARARCRPTSPCPKCRAGSACRRPRAAPGSRISPAPTAFASPIIATGGAGSSTSPSSSSPARARAASWSATARARWRRKATGPGPPTPRAPPNGRAERIASHGVEREVVSFYRVGDIVTGSGVEVKLETMKVAPVRRPAARRRDPGCRGRSSRPGDRRFPGARSGPIDRLADRAAGLD